MAGRSSPLPMPTRGYASRSARGERRRWDERDHGEEERPVIAALLVAVGAVLEDKAGQADRGQARRDDERHGERPPAPTGDANQKARGEHPHGRRDMTDLHRNARPTCIRSRVGRNRASVRPDTQRHVAD